MNLNKECYKCTKCGGQPDNLRSNEAWNHLVAFECDSCDIMFIQERTTQLVGINNG